MTMTAVITGASGFIAGNLAGRLQKSRAFDVIAASRADGRIDGRAVWTQVDDYCQTPKGDILVHLAEDPDRARVNTIGDDYRAQSGAVLDALLAKNYQHVIYVFSTAVYGEHGDEPFREDAATQAPDT